MLSQLLAALLGISLLAVPAVTRQAHPEALLAQLAGALIAGVALVAMSELLRGLRWLTATLGLSLVAAEAVVGAHGLIGLYGALAGTAVMLLSLLPGSQRHSFAGGWRSLM
ncbi:MAG: hypothetical protein RL033_3204 [Pseudomonadota bacterium]|jgi:hypothetical protein